MPGPPPPDVSVIVGAYNAMPYLTRCLDSAVGQSIGHARMEIIAVDDGSTDGSGAELDRFAEAYAGLVRVVHQENSGGPSAPRNAGLELATGRYVFFLDADDHLGAEALERLAGTADTNRSDVVLGRVVGVGGRHAPRSMFKRSESRTSVFDSRVYWSLNPMKLFRRELIERHGLRFRTDLVIGEDQPFTATAYLRAEAISVVADYDCLYWVARDDGGNITRLARGTEYRLRVLAAMFALIAEETEPGPGRDLLLLRHFTIDLRNALAQLALEPRRADQVRAVEALREVLAPWYGEGVAARMPALDRLQCGLVLRGMADELLEVLRYGRALSADAGAGAATELAEPTEAGPTERLTTVTEDGRVYARYPYFRDPARALPDHLYDITRELRAHHRLDSCTAVDGTYRITGHASLRRLSTDGVDTALVLRERGGTTEYRLPVTPVTPVTPVEADAEAGFEVTLDPVRAAEGKPLPDGLWDLYLDVGAQGVVKRVRFGAERGPEAGDGQPLTQLVRTPAHGLAVTAYFTTPHGNLSLDVGEGKHQVPSQLQVDETGWAPGERSPVLAVTGHCTLAWFPPGALTLHASPDAESAGARQGPVEVRDDGRFTARLPLPDRGAGPWRVSLRLTIADRAWTLPLPSPPPPPTRPGPATTLLRAVRQRLSRKPG
ncbi:glycosyltransferase [Streptomyces sp. N2-109]|uniref:Glycosyltransferase n=1 Tax=Streptomyces gossypii TaxID=2883101 RepID=A0ABT2K3C7_9ACTN|nr:glycosyltransferase [Streptomyces gossypii]MCT2594476.1 glycosyltransferase [Streptomyces gossypii]